MNWTADRFQLYRGDSKKKKSWYSALKAFFSRNTFSNAELKALDGFLGLAEYRLLSQKQVAAKTQLETQISIELKVLEQLRTKIARATKE